MSTHNESNPKSQRPLPRLQLATYIILQSGIIGLISGSLLGGLFGCTLLVFIWTGTVGAGLGLGLGLVNGLLLGAITCLFFYPLKDVRLYHVIVTLMSASTAGAGAAIFGPWYFSSKAMTPGTAVFIGFSSVLASVVAGWTGALAGQSMAQWYDQKSAIDREESSARQIPHSIITSNTSNTSNQPNRLLAAILVSKKTGWISVALFSLFCPFPGNWLLKILVCGELDPDVFSCLLSPRLYTSVVAGFKAALPIILLILLMLALLQSRYKRRT
ncbi:hypothetical protein IQ268_15815 [Oculatella sp. LEGE 06141]|uniref:hypothetical protein n=1 Tax=Oculatella sp. LEGE 06141 TaxID=1828648 RepID=UPI001880CB2E|nr:hypothetical protein [Oculatella sp. LEGE 06141]MBE9180037.1 hypothetical protein [Oculatella sp. LEGE 06141]